MDGECGIDAFHEDLHGLAGRKGPGTIDLAGITANTSQLALQIQRNLALFSETGEPFVRKLTAFSGGTVTTSVGAATSVVSGEETARGKARQSPVVRMKWRIISSSDGG